MRSYRDASQLHTCLLSQLFLCLTPLSHPPWRTQGGRWWAPPVVGTYATNAVPLPTLLEEGEAWSISSWVNIVTGSVSPMSAGAMERSEVSQTGSASLLLSQRRLWGFSGTFTPSLSSVFCLISTSPTKVDPRTPHIHATLSNKQGFCQTGHL